MSKTCETCRHCRDFKVVGLEVFPSICKAPTAKKHDFALRFTEVMRQDGWLMAWLFNTCGKRGRWWQPIIKTQKPEKSIDARDQWGFPSFYEEMVPITSQQWEELTKSIDDFKSTNKHHKE